MGVSTFSGPIRSGTQRYGATGTERNVGLATLVQAVDSGDLTNAVVGNIDFNFGRLPAGFQITDIVVDQRVAAATGTTTVSVGTSQGGAELMAAVATTAGGRFRGVATAATQAAWFDATEVDKPLWARIAVGTATLTAGRLSVTVMYVQRLPGGLYLPTFSQT